MSKKAVLIFLILVCGSLCILGGTHNPWDGTKWDVTSPDIDQPHGNTYKEIYDLRKGVAIRINKEHTTLATSSAGGLHKQGSARAFFQDTAPATRVDGTAFDANDLGSLWFDSNSVIDNQFNVLTATTPTWTPISTEVIAVFLASNRQFAGNLIVDGTTTLTGAVTANGGITLGADDDLIGSSTSDITINTDKFTVAGATGNTSVAGTLGVTGIATLGDASKMATSAAPTADAELANKKYVDDQIDDTVGTGTFNPLAYAGEESVTFPNGVIIKMGESAGIATSTTGTITFGTAFPNSISCVSLSRRLSDNESTAREPRIHSKSTTAFSVYNYSSNTIYVNWIAVGR